jgi:apolipoprotein N-acyltransferase
VPFGEYIPLKRIFRFLETIAPIGDIERGREYTIFQVPNSASNLKDKFGVLICFEDLFPQISREFVKRGSGFLVNITNDAWYKYSSAAAQHLQASIFRAVENKVSLVRAANTGISGFILPSGKVAPLVNDLGKDIFFSGYQTQYIYVPRENYTFYSRHGDIFIGVISLFIFCVIVGRLLKRKNA